MADETHKLQKEPAEGSRKVIEHELERQAGQSKPGEKGPQDRGATRGKADDTGGKSGSR